MIEVPSGFKVLNPEPLDGWSGPYSGDTESEAKGAALSAIPSSVRYPTMDVVLIIDGTPKKYWFTPGVADVDLKEVINQDLVTEQVGIATQMANQASIDREAAEVAKVAAELARDQSIIIGDSKANYKEVDLIGDIEFPLPVGIVIVREDTTINPEFPQVQFYYNDGTASTINDLWMLPTVKRSNVLNQ